MKKLSADSDDMSSWVYLEGEGEGVDIEIKLFSIEDRIEECLKQFKSRVDDDVAELEAKVEESSGLIVELFPEGKRLELHQRHKDRFHFLENFARNIKVVVDCAPQPHSQEQEQINKQMEVKLKEEELLDKRFQDYAKDVELKLEKRCHEYVKDIELKLEEKLQDQRQNLEKQLEDQRQNLEKQLQKLKIKQKKLHDQYLATNASRPKEKASSPPSAQAQKPQVQQQQQPSYSSASGSGLFSAYASRPKASSSADQKPQVQKQPRSYTASGLFSAFKQQPRSYSVSGLFYDVDNCNGQGLNSLGELNCFSCQPYPCQKVAPSYSSNKRSPNNK